ncbi:MAG: SDR family NAD(P)-dependent oxidoreductase [Candidatus Izemoplasmatales bacterium]|nr:SDR family NAD(P)-dependent oxidoreductase [Candidatus Izemoplasmatales bacterium]
MNVLITGAAGGLGRAFVEECVSKGDHVFATDLREKELSHVVQGIYYRYGIEIPYHACDLTREEELHLLVQKLGQSDFEVDALFLVAGVDHEGGFLQKDFHQIQGIVELNILATMRLTHAMLLRRNRDRYFSIMFISSLAAGQPIPLKATYAASKRFLLDFSRAIREELREEQVRVLTVCPAGLATNDEVIKAIMGQGFFGSLTTCNIESVVKNSRHLLLHSNRAVYIPGRMNQWIHRIQRLIPLEWTMRILHHRWKKAQSTWLHPKKER